MKLGAEPKKVVILTALLIVAGYSLYTNVFSSPATPAPKGVSPTQSQRQQVALPQPSQPGASAPPRRASSGRATVSEFRPSLKHERPEDRPDPMKVDPTLRLDLLARLENITVEGGQRSLFDFSAPPPPKDDPKVIPGPQTKKKDPPPPPPTPEDPKKADPPKPPPPPIPLKFYGFSAPRAGAKRAFFLEGEEIYVATEGELIKRRYKIVRIGVNSVVVEDTEHKHQQTLPLEEPPVTG
jgi:hypothetical protein